MAMGMTLTDAPAARRDVDFTTYQTSAVIDQAIRRFVLSKMAVAAAATDRKKHTCAVKSLTAAHDNLCDMLKVSHYAYVAEDGRAYFYEVADDEVRSWAAPEGAKRGWPDLPAARRRDVREEVRSMNETLAAEERVRAFQERAARLQGGLQR